MIDQQDRHLAYERSCFSASTIVTKFTFQESGLIRSTGNFGKVDQLNQRLSADTGSGCIFKLIYTVLLSEFISAFEGQDHTEVKCSLAVLEASQC